MKKKAIRITMIILLVISLTMIVFIGRNNKKEADLELEENKMCNTIRNDLNNKKNLILYFADKEDETQNSEIKKHLEETYSDITIHQLKNEDKEKECIKEVLEKNSLYNELDDSSALIIYKQGEYKGFMINVDNINQIEDYLASLKVITKQEVQEAITLNVFKEKIKLDKYILLIVADEKARNFYNEELQEEMAEYTYDIVNLNTTLGKEISNYVYTNFEKTNEFPKIYYFSKNVLKTSETIYGEQSIIEFKSLIK